MYFQCWKCGETWGLGASLTCKCSEEEDMTQPEALRLADALETAEISYTSMVKAAAELRRLLIENEALGLHLSERMKDLARVEAQRDALLETLKAAIVRAELRREGAVDVEVIRAAIKQAEENK